MHREEPKINPVRNIRHSREENKISNGVNCLTFQKQEPVIKEITDKINRAETAPEKAKLAEQLQKEVNVLLSCSDRKEGHTDCASCHFIAKLRKRTADLIIKAQKLS